MAYRLKRSDASVERGVRRIARQQIGAAIAAIDDHAGDFGARVHDVRTHCKKLRGLLRLVRPAFPAYREENKRFREISRRLSRLREANVLVATLDKLKPDDSPPAFDAARQRLSEQAHAVRAEFERGDALAATRTAMLAALARVDEWRLTADGFEALGGLRKTYKQALEANAKARAQGSVEAFHDWRKRIKDHGYHTLLLRSIRPARIAGHARAASKLGKVLGNHHDIVVLREALRADEFADVHATIDPLIEHRRASLERKALKLGARLLDDRAKQLTRRWEGWWLRWRPARPKATVVRLVVSR